jgi:predicted Holliday junction resolvase-like endonuclease
VTPDAVTLALALAIAGLLLALAATLAFLRWKARYTEQIRADAIRQSRAVTTGKVAEQLVPHFPHFPFNPREARFLGSPVDYVVFQGLEEGEVRSIVFVEVKTGAAGLSGRERLVREAVRLRRVEWLELRTGEG